LPLNEIHKAKLEKYVLQDSIISALLTSGNRTPGSRFYSDLLDTLVDSVCIHQLVLKRRSKY